MRSKLTSYAVFISLICITPAWCEKTVETIILLRHGEKQPQGLGQLSCKGLNRSLALPRVLVPKYGVPAAIFAPNSSVQKKDQGQPFDYISPLATIEPTAIGLGLPVHTQLSFTDTNGLRAEIEKPEHNNHTLYVAWEHKLIDLISRDLLTHNGGDPKLVPIWADDDFDSVYIIVISRDNNNSATFIRKQQGLNGVAESCP